jgi:ribosomal protein L37AE/L43A
MSENTDGSGGVAEDHGDVAPVVGCPDCQSNNVRPSHSAYPLDRVKVEGRDLAFWRCENCGTRFPGPPHPPRPSRRGKHRSSRHVNDELTQGVKFARAAKRLLFPVLVILATIIAVVYILDRRNSRQEQSIISPD